MIKLTNLIANAESKLTVYFKGKILLVIHDPYQSIVHPRKV